ncbi:MAG TPA: alpha-amylase [Firmicutes bacterium]|nr:alpha-amylase [Bacillota bacterium]
MERKMDFEKRLNAQYDQLKWTYHYVYDQYGATDDDFESLIQVIKTKSMQRSNDLKALDNRNRQWFMSENMVGMMLYVDLFGGDLNQLINKIPYFKELGITYVHLMPLLKPRDGENDGGYAVEDYREIDPKLGTMEDFIKMLSEFRKANIAVCIDYVLNHTAKEHEWAKLALQGQYFYQQMYMMYEHYDIPAAFNETVPEVLPDKCPGNFTYYPEINRHVFTSFSDFQWDLNFKNPTVFKEMVDILLFLANTGVNIIRLDAIPFMWKELGTTCRNLDMIHELLHLIYLIKEIACPSLVLLGEAIVEPHEIVKYFGNEDKVECELMYNANFMVNIWNSLATRNTHVMRIDSARYVTPKSGTWINYARCHDDIGWGFSEDAVWQTGSNPVDHKQFIIDFYSGKFPGSFAKGEIYQYNPVTQDARINGTLASLVGLENALTHKDLTQKELSLSRINLIHALLLSAQGIPLIYSGDELGMLNDYRYLNDADKYLEGRWVHRNAMDWAEAEKRHDEFSTKGNVFQTLKKLIEVRKSEPLFSGQVNNEILPLSNTHIYGIAKYKEDEKMITLFNFSEHKVFIPTHEVKTYGFTGTMKDLLSEKHISLDDEIIVLEPYEYAWYK